MTTITKEFTKEQLIEQAKKNIEVLRVAVERVPGASDAAVIHLKLAEITLASLEAEPVAWMRDDADGREYNARNEFSGGGGGIPLYATPQVQVVPEEMYWQDAPVEGSSKAAAYATGWNDCRATMLKGDKS